MELHRPWRTEASGSNVIVDVTPDDAGWAHAGLTVVRLEAGVPHVVRTGGRELFVLPLSGAVSVAVVGADGSSAPPTHLAGRRSVFTAATDFLYVGRDSVATLTSAGGAEVALPSATCDEALPSRAGRAGDVPVEVRGAGRATRQVRNLGVPGVWDHAARLICCEVLTPPGGWSSYPPHKHDRSDPCEVATEEIYYYRIAGEDRVTPSRRGFGYHRTYTTAEHERVGLATIDLLAEVRDHDVVLVPHGYHGPCLAAPDYPMYYLNVMAGPTERSMAFCDDPDHAWVRAGWDRR